MTTKLLLLGLLLELVGVGMITYPALKSKEDLLKALGWAPELEHGRKAKKKFREIKLIRWGLVILLAGILLQIVDVVQKLGS